MEQGASVGVGRLGQFETSPLGGDLDGRELIGRKVGDVELDVGRDTGRRMTLGVVGGNAVTAESLVARAVESLDLERYGGIDLTD